MDYGQNVVLNTGNFLYSVPTINLTMDFSKKLVDDGIVDNVLDEKVRFSFLCFPCFLESKEVWPSTMSTFGLERLI